MFSYFVWIYKLQLFYYELVSFFLYHDHTVAVRQAPTQNLVWLSKVMTLRTHREDVKRLLQNKASGGGEKGWLPRLVQNDLREQGKEAGVEDVLG